MRLLHPARAGAVGHRSDDVAGAADRGQAQVGAVTLGVAADVDGALGSHSPRLSSGADADVAPWSSSMTTRSSRARTAASSFARRGRRDAGRVVRRGWRNTATGACHRRRRPAGRHALVVEVDADHFGAEQIEQVEQRRKRRVLDHDTVAEAHHHLGDAIERVHRAVDDGQLLRLERPPSRNAVERGQHGWSR